MQAMEEQAKDAFEITLERIERNDTFQLIPANADWQELLQWLQEFTHWAYINETHAKVTEKNLDLVKKKMCNMLRSDTQVFALLEEMQEKRMELLSPFRERILELSVRARNIQKISQNPFTSMISVGKDAVQNDIKNIIEFGCCADFSINNQTLLNYVDFESQSELAIKLLKDGADFKKLVRLPAKLPNRELLILLIEKGMDPNIKFVVSTFFCRPLLSLVLHFFKDDVDLVNFLLQSGAQTDLVYKEHNGAEASTPWEDALKTKANPKIIELMKKYRTSLIYTDEYRWHVAYEHLFNNVRDTHCSSWTRHYNG